MRYIYPLLILLPFLINSGCSKDEPKPQTSTKRTILVYMVAANSLGSSGFDLQDIAEMKEGAKKGMKNCRLLVYHNSFDKDSRLFEINDKGEEKTLVEYNDNIYSTSADRMNEVIEDAKKLAPALDYGLVLWSHATAWIEPAIDPDSKKIESFGDDRGRNMSISTLANVLNNKHFSFIYFDCCHMANVETVYELRYATNYIVGSTIELPADGMPYDQNISLLFEDTPDLRQACVNTFNFYNSKVYEYQRTCTMSLIDTSKLDALAEICKQVISINSTLPDDFEPQEYQTSGAKYLFDLAQYMHSLDTQNQFVGPIVKSISDAVIYEAHTDRIWGDKNIENNCGLSCYIINAQDGADYKGYDKLQWYKDVVSVAQK